MMLGLSTHEPHFALLREEVRFGGKDSQKRSVIELMRSNTARGSWVSIKFFFSMHMYMFGDVFQINNC